MFGWYREIRKIFWLINFVREATTITATTSSDKARGTNSANQGWAGGSRSLLIIMVESSVRPPHQVGLAPQIWYLYYCGVCFVSQQRQWGRSVSVLHQETHTTHTCTRVICGLMLQRSKFSLFVERGQATKPCQRFTRAKRVRCKRGKSPN